MAIAVASTAFNIAQANPGSVIVDKPTGLAEGELMVATITAHVTSGGVGISTPSGWTVITSDTAGDSAVTIFYKVATSGDVAASNFTFTEPYTAATVMSGTILRVTGNRPSGFVGVSDSGSAGSGTGLSFTTSSTPTVNECLVIAVLAGAQTNNGAGTIGSYSLTPTVSLTEASDQSLNQGDIDPIVGVAYGVLSTAAEITNLSATLSLTKDESVAAIATFYPTVDASGTTSLLAVSPTQISPSGRADTNANATLIESDPSFVTQSGSATTPTTWTNETPETTTWTNETES